MSVKFEKLPWSREAKALRLELIREHHNVWDPKQPDYHKIKLRQEVFSQIASVMRQQFEELRQLTGGKLLYLIIDSIIFVS
ncbi:hypothetical protein E2C01_090018 [Portunus trituberculatus]|uniref:MADF domain-containing protein n=1 Tax=Portunus trituberculatus TaxID=210409 RepID=A0A5B7JF40_PORTR|nr:hypothetical protein [Portunus trituberculatus]